MEKPDFRDNMELLNDLYPGKAALTINEALKILPMSRDAIDHDETFPRVRKKGRIIIPKVGLARWLSA